MGKEQALLDLASADDGLGDFSGFSSEPDNRFCGGKISAKTIAALAVCVVLIAAAFGGGIAIGGRLASSSVDNDDNGTNVQPEPPVPPQPAPRFPLSWLQLVSDAKEMMNVDVNPCDDFYEYACGTFAAGAVQTGGVDVKTFDDVYLHNTELISRLVEEQWPFITDLHESCVADGAAAANATSDTVVTSVLETLDAYTNGKVSLLAMSGTLARQFGIELLFSPVVQNNFLVSPSHNRWALVPAGFGQFDWSDPQLRQGFENNMATLFAMTPALANRGMNNPTFALAAAKDAVAMMQMLAERQQPTEYTDATPMTFSAALSSTNLSNLADYFDAFSAGKAVPKADDTVILYNHYFENLQGAVDAFVLQYGARSIKHYALAQMIMSFLQNDVVFYSTDSSISAAHALRTAKKSLGVEGPLPQRGSSVSLSSGSAHSREIECTRAVENHLSDLLGHIFSEIVVSDEVRNDTFELARNIADAFGEGVKKLKWLDEESLDVTLTKLVDIIPVVGHPSVLALYRNVSLSSKASFAQNLAALSKFGADRAAATVGTPFVRANSEFTATVVNAFYNPTSNTINFPAGILRPTFFSATYPKLAQYARMGYVVGHETTHSFDSGGRYWGPTGKYGDWLSNYSGAQYDERAKCIVDLYDKFEIGNSGQYVDGRKCLGENIADLGGAKYAHNAYLAEQLKNGDEFNGAQLFHGLSNEQTFWLFLGQTWCTRATDNATIAQTKYDDHSPSKWRVNGPLSQTREFALAYQCPEGSFMNPKEKCSLW